MRQNFTTQQQQQQQGHNVATRVLTSPVGYSTEVPPNTNCQPPPFRLPRNNINMTTSSNSQISGIYWMNSYKQTLTMFSNMFIVIKNLKLICNTFVISRWN